MTQTSGNFWILWPQLLYSLPFVLVSVAAVIVCVMNWQKAPTPALFCLIGFGLIGFNSVFGGFMTFLMIRSGTSSGTLRELWSILSAIRILFSLAGYVFLLIAVFSGRQPHATPNPLAPNQPASPK